MTPTVLVPNKKVSMLFKILKPDTDFTLAIKVLDDNFQKKAVLSMLKIYCDETQSVQKLPLPHYHAKISAQMRGLHFARHN